MLTLKTTRPTPNDPMHSVTTKIDHPPDWQAALARGFYALSQGALSFTVSIEDERGHLIRALTYNHNGTSVARTRRTQS